MKSEGYDDDALEKLMASLSDDKAPVGRIGVLGGHTIRTMSDVAAFKKLAGLGPESTTNAEIGAKHELGLDGMPERSWLRIPIIDNMQTYLNDAGAFTTKTAKKVIKSGSMRPWLESAMLVAENIVSDGFNSGGFGKWKPSNMTHKTNHQTLVETHQLRDSVTSEVKDGGE